MVIYVHIPFCIKKCDYCDFLSAPCDKATRAEYVRSLDREMRYYGKKYGRDGRNIKVSSIFFGGGTPSILDEEQLASLMETLKECFYIEENAEITVECNPGTLTESKVKTYKKAGINRLSIGLQSADDKELMSVGRIHTFEEFLEGYRMAREAGFDNINIDIMSALPGQTVESYRSTIEKVVKLQPEHISAYSLILEEGTELYSRVEELIEGNKPTGLPDEDTEREMYYMTESLLKESGYGRYEISNYAKAGYQCRHNTAYWRRDDYIGMGLGASSCMDNVRTKNITDINRYMEIFGEAAYMEENGAIDANETDVLTTEDMMAEFMFLGLRMMDGVSKRKFQKLFGITFEEVYGSVTDKLIKEGLVMVPEDKDRLCLTIQGIDVSNMVLAQYLV